VRLAMSDIPANAVKEPRRAVRSRFFTGMCALLFGITLVGFSRTLYLRNAFGLSALPTHLYAHGAVLTGWFALALVQAYFIMTARTHIHRALGVAGVLLAIAVVVVSIVTLVQFSLANEFPDLTPILVSGNLSSLIAFSACFTSGVLLRHRPEAHKRLVLLASIAIVAPALDRLARLPMMREFFVPLLGGFPVPYYLVFAAVALVALLGAVLVFDIVSQRRVHPATLWGVACIVLIGQIFGAAIGRGGPWARFVALFR
jgi:hypothetical protein